MKALMVLLNVPVPETGASTRNYHLLKALAREWDMTVLVLGTGEDAQTRAKVAQLSPLVDSVRLVAPPPRRSKRVDQLLSLARGASHSVAACTYPAVQAALDAAFNSDHYDVV